jgi:Glycosyltransferase
MKILVVCQHYWPEPYPLEDICEELVNRGHEVDIITDVPNYPMGDIYPGYEHHRNRNETHGGVSIIRTFTIPRKHNTFFRMLNYYSFAFSSSIYAKRLKKEYDVVFTNQSSPIIMCSAAFAYAKKHSKKVVMYCMDLWPASLAAGGLSEKSIIYKHFGKVSGKIYRKADRILITSQMFRDYLIQQHHVDSKRISYLPQYADAMFENLPVNDQTKETIDLVFAGNVGAAQSIETIIKAANYLKNESSLRWHIVGDGSELENCKHMVEEFGLSNVIFHGRKPIEEMPKYYSMADAMLVTLTADPLISRTLPRKVQTYMAAGKTIIGAATGEIQNTISAAGCGYCADAEDADGLAKAVNLFVESKDKNGFERNAREYYMNHFTRKHFMDSLENELTIYTNLEKRSDNDSI